MNTQTACMGRRRFIGGAVSAAGAGAFALSGRAGAGDALDEWQRETSLVSAAAYRAYMADGDTRSLASLEKLEKAFDKVLAEVRSTEVGDVPAVWCVYNMGCIVKTREAVFSIDLVHRRAAEFAPLLDFALITHNHGDHWGMPLYRSMDSSGKTVISNFLDNYGAADWRKGGPDWMKAGGYTRARRTFRIKDVEISTSLVDHNAYLVDFTTAFVIKSRGWTMYHTGDCGHGSEGKLGEVHPDLWVFFPGCGIDVGKAVRRVGARRVALGHMWELGHDKGRLTTPMVRKRLAAAAAAGCKDVFVPLWGDRIS